MKRENLSFNRTAWIAGIIALALLIIAILVEKTALRNQDVVETFRKHNVLLLKADLTRENPPAKRLLENMGSRSIPFLALFPPGEHFWQPFFLRDIYRARDVLRAFEIAAERQ